MRFPKSLYIPKLSSVLSSILTRISLSRTLPACLIQRAKLVLMATEGRKNKEIAAEIGLHPTTVGKWRTRFINAQEGLSAIENDRPEELEEKLICFLKDAPRSGAAPVYTADQHSFIITIACQNPKDHGFELSHWSLSALRLAVINKGIVENISASQISRILSKNEIRPHKNQYWLHSAEKAEDPESYKAKVKAINEVYALANEIASSNLESNTFILSTDEMTGVQALEHKYPDKLPVSGMSPKQEFEYIRHGTLSLTAFLNVVDGTIFEPYTNNTRTEADFVAALDKIIQKDPDKEYIIVADNLNTHYSAALVEYVARQLNYPGELGKKRKDGILCNKASRIKFLTDPSHRIRFLYTPKHCSWMNQIEIWFGIINRQLLKRMSYTSVEELAGSIRSYVRQYNKLFAHPFNWKYNTTPLGD